VTPVRRVAYALGFAVGRALARLRLAPARPRCARNIGDSAVYRAALELLALDPRIQLLSLEARLPSSAAATAPRHDLFAWRVGVRREMGLLPFGTYVFAGPRPEDGLHAAARYLEGFGRHVPARSAIVVDALEVGVPGRLS